MVEELVAALRGRRDEMVAAARERTGSLRDAPPRRSADLVAKQEEVVGAAIDYCLCGLEVGDAESPSIPPAAIREVAHQARGGKPLQAILRRYVAGYNLLNEYLLEEATRSGLKGEDLKRLLRLEARLFDRLLEGVSETYELESSGRPRSVVERTAAVVRALVQGDRLDAADLPYSLSGVHLAMIVVGEGAEAAVRELAGALDRQALVVPRPDRTAWAWLGGRRSVETDVVREFVEAGWARDLRAVIGEPGRDLPGWRLSHRQARAALPLIERSHDQVLRYSEVALLAGVIGDEVLAASLRQLYIAPLETDRDRGEASLRTLRAYFDCGRQASSAAVLLGVTRQTVAARLRAIEEKLGTSLDRCATELDVAMKLAEAIDTG